jgi:hypothetical protein
MKAPVRAMGAGEAALYETSPDPRGYLFRYLLALTPLVLYAVSVFTAGVMEGYFGGFSPLVRGQIGALVPGMGDLVEISILLTAPAGIYLTFVIIGWIVRSAEMWAGSALALGLASLAGLILSTVSPDRTLSPALDLLYWIAYLIGFASVAAVIVVLAWIELSRRSIRYIITAGGVILKGGIWKQQENLLPWHQIGRLVMEQNPVEKLLNTGTVIPVGTGNPVPAAGRKGAGKAGEDLSRDPLDCLSGIRDPELVMALLQKLSSESPGGMGGTGVTPAKVHGKS